MTGTGIRSGDRIATGIEGERRRLTAAEAAAGGLPAPFTSREWRALRRATHAYAREIGVPDTIRVPIPRDG